MFILLRTCLASAISLAVMVLVIQSALSLLSS